MPKRTPRGGRRSFKPRLPSVGKPPLTRRPVRIPTLYTPPPYYWAGGNMYNTGTLPERIVGGWLNAHAAEMGFTWRFQEPELGFATGTPGSAKVDFLVEFGGRRLYMRIVGIYWHLSSAGTAARDALQKSALSAWGLVIDLYENDIYIPGGLDDLMRDALRGIERPPPFSLATPHRPLGF